MSQTQEPPIAPVGEGEEFKSLAADQEAARIREAAVEPELSEDGSLKDRMAARAKQLEQQQTGWFGIPGWDDLLEVELRALGYKTTARIRERLGKIKDQPTRELYALADTIVTATEGFREIVSTDGEEKVVRRLDDDWIRLAQRLPDCPDAPTPRQAILFLVGEKRIAFLVQEWGEWASTVRKDVDEELVRDFSTTARRN